MGGMKPSKHIKHRKDNKNILKNSNSRYINKAKPVKSIKLATFIARPSYC
jgi:hypothetical protein